MSNIAITTVDINTYGDFSHILCEDSTWGPCCSISELNEAIKAV